MGTGWEGHEGTGRVRVMFFIMKRVWVMQVNAFIRIHYLCIGDLCVPLNVISFPQF